MLVKEYILILTQKGYKGISTSSLISKFGENCTKYISAIRNGQMPMASKLYCHIAAIVNVLKKRGIRIDQPSRAHRWKPFEVKLKVQTDEVVLNNFYGNKTMVTRD